jgi:membrane protease YdiL (CAAX protease family)
MLQIEYIWSMGHLILLFLVVLAPVLDLVMTPRLKRSENPNRRLIEYALTVAVMWTITMLVVIDSPKDLLVSPMGNSGYVGLIIAIVAMVLVTGYLGQGIVQVLRQPALRAQTHQQFASLDFFLPQTRLERQAFVLVCLSAGITEEVIFRSFLVRYFMLEPYGWPVFAAVCASCLVFGLNHIYQGWKGALSTVAIAAGFSVMVFGMRSLIPVMVLHVLIDLRVLVFTLPEGHPLLKQEGSNPPDALATP